MRTPMFDGLWTSWQPFDWSNNLPTKKNFFACYITSILAQESELHTFMYYFAPNHIAYKMLTFTSYLLHLLLLRLWLVIVFYKLIASTLLKMSSGSTKVVKFIFAFKLFLCCDFCFVKTIIHSKRLKIPCASHWLVPIPKPQLIGLTCLDKSWTCLDKRLSANQYIYVDS